MEGQPTQMPPIPLPSGAEAKEQPQPMSKPYVEPEKKKKTLFTTNADGEVVTSTEDQESAETAPNIIHKRGSEDNDMKLADSHKRRTGQNINREQVKQSKSEYLKQYLDSL